ncbi:ABC transporter permease subunit [Clostridium estertheticum]|uniref:ABC transporter permease subunit n=1 Tax=Clostridium estertheticum TaxID=238834 RepID=UPI001C6F11FD|nr:ABC transporter permease subunit [Clostridium estertheticum]MBW9153437.1 ABC transporter permease [Clostridium estertheticum]WLC84156.1 ABC transporter permease [Clostridium estertheticum]
MNMFLHELKAYRKSTIIWTVSLITLVVLFLAMFPSFSKEADAFKEVMKGFPEPVRKAMGFSVDSMSSVLGFYSYMFLYTTLCGAIQAMNLGTSIVSKEVRNKTADFLLTKPVTRRAIMTSKLLASLSCLVITNVVYLVASSIMVSLVATEKYSYKIFFMISITLFFIQLMFLALGIIISVLIPKSKSVLPISLGTVFAFFIIGMFEATLGDNTMRYITPFKYFDSTYILKNSSYEISFIIVGIVFIAFAIICSYLIYSKKDVHAA